MIDTPIGSGWREAESRRMIEDARALVSMAQSLADARTVDAEVHRRAGAPSAAAVLVHAVSLHEEDVAPRPAGALAPGVPILVLLDEAPATPEFLPEGADVDLDKPTEEAVRMAIERRVRGALEQPPSTHHLLDLVESLGDAVIAVDRRETVVYLNPRATALLQTLTGRTGPFVGQPLGTAFPPALSATTRPAIHDALAHANATRVEDPERHRGIALDIAIFPYPDGATLLVRDATRRRDVEAELIETRLSLARAESRLSARDDEASA